MMGNAKDLKKAYNNKEFLNGKQARPIRVLCELLEPEERLEANRQKYYRILGPLDPNPKMSPLVSLKTLRKSKFIT